MKMRSNGMSDEKVIALSIPFQIEVDAETDEEALKKVGESLGDRKELLRNLFKQKGIELSEEELDAINSSIISSYIQIDKVVDANKKDNIVN
jgi:hypothetical protein